MLLGRIRGATSPGVRACIVIVVVVAAVNLWKLTVGLDADPVLHRSGLAVVEEPGILPGEHTIDPNDGYTLQALGRAAADSWLDGDAPYWNRFEGVGSPLAGEMQSMALHPQVLLHRLPQGFLLGQIVMQALAGIATVFFLRRLGIGEAVSLGAGIAFAFNGTFAWLSNAAASPIAYLPLLLWGVEIAREAAIDGGRRGRRRGGWALIAIAIAGSLYAGFPETAYIDGLFVLVWCVARLTGLGRLPARRFVLKLAAGAVVGVLMAAPILLAFLDYLPRANVGGHTGALATVTVPRISISALFMPYVYGPINAFTANTTSADLGAFWRIGGYLSALQLVLALLTIGIRRLRSVQIGLLVWFVVYLAKTYGFSPIITAVNWVPGMNEMAFFRYSQPSVTMGMLILAAFGAQRLLDSQISRRQVVITAAAVAATLVLLVIYASTETRHFVGAPHYRLYLIGSFAFAACGAAVVGLIVWAPQRSWRAGALAAFVAIDAAVMFIVPQLSTDRMSEVDVAPVEFLQQHLGLQRFYTLGPIAPNYGSYYGIASINQNDVPVPKSWSEYIVTHLDTNADPTLFTGYSRVDPAGPTAFFQFVDHVHEFARVGTKYLVTNTDPPTAQRLVDAGLTKVFDDSRTSIFQLPGASEYFQVPPEACTVTAISWQVADVQCDQPSTLVRLELDDPGWSATIDGADATVSTAGEIFQSVDVPAGTSRVTFRFAPRGMWFAWLTALAAAVGMVLWSRWPTSDDRDVSEHDHEPSPEPPPDAAGLSDSQRLEQRLHWIYAASSPEELQQRYDEWAADYDSDLDGMAWAAPQAGAARCAAFVAPGGEVLDAGCGTGLVGVSLRRLGVERIVGFDLSIAMLTRASDTGVYTELLQGSLLEPLPFDAGRFAGAVSVGVFTHGHVGPAAFAGLARVVAPGGHISMTFRDDAVDPLGYRAEAERLEAEGVWTLVERTEPEPLIMEGDVGADMRVWTWRVS